MTIRDNSAPSEAAEAPEHMTVCRGTSVCVVLAVHNRRALTCRLLSALQALDAKGELDLSVVLTDDGSTDGTAAAARATFPKITILRGDGDLYYAAGMSLAQDVAIRNRPDFVLWMNDDVELDEGAIEEALTASASADVLVGATRSAEGGITYSGMRQIRGRYGRAVGVFAEVEPSGSLQEIDTFQGNFVLLSRDAYERIGPVDGRFAHGLSDVDYGLRARAAGLRIVLLGRPIGLCERNPVERTWEDVNLPILRRLQLLRDRKAFPLASQWRFAARHGGVLAPLWFLSTYGSALKRIVRTGIAHRVHPG